MDDEEGEEDEDNLRMRPCSFVLLNLAKSHSKFRRCLLGGGNPDRWGMCSETETVGCSSCQPPTSTTTTQVHNAARRHHHTIATTTSTIRGCK